MSELIDETKYLEQLMEAQSMLRSAVATIDKIANRCHRQSADFSRLEIERLRHQGRANDAAVRCSHLNDEIDRIQALWHDEQKTVVELLNQSIHALLSKDSGKQVFAVSQIERFLRCLPNASVDRAASAAPIQQVVGFVSSHQTNPRNTK